MKARLGQALSWLALAALVLLGFCGWFFLLRADPPEHGEELISKACPGEKLERLERAGIRVFFRRGPCQEVSEPLARDVLRWSQATRQSFGSLRLPDLLLPVAIDLRKAGPAWKADSPRGWPGAVQVRVANGKTATRFRLDSALIALAIKDAAPATAPGDLRLLAEALALRLPHSEGIEFTFVLPERVLALSRGLDGWPGAFCRSGRCQVTD